MENKLNGEDKTKSILFASKRKSKNVHQLNIRYNNIKTKQHSEVTYLGSLLNGTMSAEPMALQVTNKINGKLKLNFFIEKIDISQKNFAECFSMFLFSHILIILVQPGTLISVKRRSRKYK